MDGERLDENVEVEKPRARFHARERRKKGRGKQVPERRPAGRLAAHHRRSIAALCPLQNTLAIGDQRPTSRSTLRWVWGASFAELNSSATQVATSFIDFSF